MSHSNLSPSCSTLWKRDDPDVVRPQLEVGDPGAKLLVKLYGHCNLAGLKMKSS